MVELSVVSIPTIGPFKAQLTSVTNPNLNPSVADTSVAYTADGQRCWQTSGSSVISSPTCGSAPTGATSYQWNTFGELCWSGQTTSTASCSSPPTGATTYTYNGDGLRMTETPSSGAALDFSYDLVDGSTPLDIDDGQYAYIYGETLFGGTAPVEQINLTTGAVSYLSSIPSGVQDVISSTGSVVEQSAYTTYGTREGTGTAGATAFGFQGAYTDSSGLIYMLARYYDPATSQFISVDPDVPETGQPYAFTGNDPLNATDPTGLIIRCQGDSCGHGAGTGDIKGPTGSTGCSENCGGSSSTTTIVGSPNPEPLGGGGGGHGSSGGNSGSGTSAAQRAYDAKIGQEWIAAAKAIHAAEEQEAADQRQSAILQGRSHFEAGTLLEGEAPAITAGQCLGIIMWASLLCGEQAVIPPSAYNNFPTHQVQFPDTVSGDEVVPKVRVPDAVVNQENQSTADQIVGDGDSAADDSGDGGGVGEVIIVIIESF